MPANGIAADHPTHHNATGLEVGRGGDSETARQTLVAVAAASAPARGLVIASAQLPFQPGLPTLSRWAALGPEMVAGRRLPEPLMGFGISPEESGARTAAVAEVVERCAVLAPPEDRLVVHAPFTALRDDALPPSAFALYSAKQLANQSRVSPLSESDPIDWRWAYSLTRHRAVLVPAALVHLSLVRHGPNTFVAEGTVTGSACHVSRHRAALAALCEVLERDALACAWLARLRLTRMDPDSSPAADLVAGPLANCGATFQLHRVPSDGPFPVVVASATSERHPAAAVGAACHPDGSAAAVRALLEAAQVLCWLRFRPSRLPSKVRTFADHADFYATPEGAGRLRPFLDDNEAMSVRALPDAADTPADVLVQEAVDALADAGHEVVVADVTTPAIADTGFVVLRVVVTGMIDINADARWPRLGGDRARQLPMRLGTGGEMLAEADLNDLPVPLA